MMGTGVLIILLILFWIIPAILLLINYKKANLSGNWLMYLLLPGYILIAAIEVTEEAYLNKINDDE